MFKLFPWQDIIFPLTIIELCDSRLTLSTNGRSSHLEES